MNLNEWFHKGLTTDEYISSMTRNKEEMLSIFEGYRVSEEDQTKLEPLKVKGLRAIVITEDWCGDALLNNPILLRISEAANMEVRFVLRDQNLELMDQYLTNGTSRAIPIFIFIDQEGNEIGVWGPRAPEIQALVEKGRTELPDKEAPDFQEKQMALYKRLAKSYQTDTGVWQTVANSILATLLK
ncbi:thioredoxin family protein [Bacillus salipaludis]|uniref:Thioredoxin family protein n=1 Tax=Bacillus salipaludis TaxID=2547811 RepID=A0A4R5VMI7_9BACI|nr:thioredoxin family protein [Bacillus salipaludis]MDQ6595621.1 thioredoxin family protein [Bacillus salipaludis]TDK58575.1 thioredoxin family protein [Bacillus salipaludis]